MGFVGSMLSSGRGTGFQANQDPNDVANVQQQYSALNGAEGQLNSIAQGQGPNPALAQLQQTTGQNIAQNAGFVASQKGINPALAANMAGKNAGMMNQQAAGQAATMQAQQQLGALGQIGQLAGSGINAVQGGINSANSANAQIANTNAQNQAGLVGGALNGFGVASSLARGGMVKRPLHYDDGGSVSLPDAGPDTSAPAPSPVTTPAPSIPDTIPARTVPDAGQASLDPAGPSAGPQSFAAKFLDPSAPPTATSAGGAATPASGIPSSGYNINKGANFQQSSGGGSGLSSLLSMGAMFMAPGGKVDAKKGGKVPGQAKVQGDSYDNDTVAAKLSPGEIVIPRHITMAGEAAPALAAEFVRSQLAMQSKKKDHYDDGGEVDDEEEAPAPAPQESGASGSWDAAAPAPASVGGGDSSPQQQISPSGIATLQSDVQSQKAANNQLAQAQGGLGQQESTVLDSQKNAMANQDRNDQQKYSDFDHEQQALMNDYANGHVDPNRFVANLSTPDKIRKGIGLILGGIGGGLTHQENPALKYLTGQIDNDIASQQAELGKRKNLLTANIEKFGNIKDAMAATRANMMGMAQIELQKAGASSKYPLAKAIAGQQNAALQTQIDQTVAPMKFKQQMIQQAAQGGQDPASVVQYLVPPAHQATVTKAIGDAKHVSQNYNSAMQNFDQASHDVRFLSSSPFSNPTYKLPFVDSPAIKSLNALEDPLIHDEAGRISPQIKKDFGNLHPQGGDDDSTIQTKRDTYSKLWLQKYGDAANTAKANNIDLTKFASTNPNAAIDRAKQRLQANPGDRAAAAFLKKAGVNGQ